MFLLRYYQHWSYPCADYYWYRRGLYVLGYPKSGTTWLSDLLATYFQVPLHGRTKAPFAQRRIVHTHRFTFCDPRRTVYLLRDGRDAIISHYQGLARQSSLAVHRDALSRRLPRPLAPEHLRENLPRFIAIVQSQWRNSMSYRRHVARGIARFFLVRYEDLRRDPCGELSRVVSHLAATVDPPRVAEAVRANQIEQVHAHPRDQRQKEFLGEGKSGGWSAAFSREAGEAFLNYCGNALVLGGYERDASWVKALRPLGANAP